MNILENLVENHPIILGGISLAFGIATTYAIYSVNNNEILKSKDKCLELKAGWFLLSKVPIYDLYKATIVRDKEACKKHASLLREYCSSS